MQYELFEYQKQAVESLVRKIAARQEYFNNPVDPEYSAIVLGAPTGAGKTVIATSVLEHLFYGSHLIHPSPGTTVLWVTDDPSLNAQTRLRLKLASSMNIRTNTIVSGKYDAEMLEPLTVHFLNTQAARLDTHLGGRRDGKPFSESQKHKIWETLANTIKERGSDFIVIVDEAHRGAQITQEVATTVNKIIDGIPENGNARVPIIIGISATADKFRESMRLNFSQHASSRTVVPVTVSVDDVRESGVIKDRVILHSPHEASKDITADTTFLRDAVTKTKDFSERWRAHCEETEDKMVHPILVVQVGDKPTDLQLSEYVAAISDSWEDITIRNMVNVFGEHAPLKLRAGEVAYIEPHLIQGQEDIRVVFAKNAITTGWDCPRVEVMVSFRNAEDPTYIAQLIGRIVRQPLAKRIESDDALNQVYCVLPKFNDDEVDAVIESFNKSDDGSVAPMFSRGYVSNTLNEDFNETEDEILVKLDVRNEHEEMIASRSKAGILPRPTASVIAVLDSPVYDTKVRHAGNVEADVTDRNVSLKQNAQDVSSGDRTEIHPPKSSVDHTTSVATHGKSIGTSLEDNEVPEVVVAPATRETAGDTTTVKKPSVLVTGVTTITEDDFLSPLPPRNGRAESVRKNIAARAVDGLPTFIIPKRKSQGSQIARLHSIASLLSLDKIKADAVESSDISLHYYLDELAAQNKEQLEKLIDKMSHVVIGARAFTIDGKEVELEDDSSQLRVARLDGKNITDMFGHIGRTTLTDGLAESYWKHLASESDGNADTLHAAMIRVSATGSLEGVRDSLEVRAEQIVDTLLRTYVMQISELEESRKVKYKEFRDNARIPHLTLLTLPKSIECQPAGSPRKGGSRGSRSDKGKRYPKHIFSDPSDKKHYAELGDWENEIIESLISKENTFAWYRNTPRGGESSLCIPYFTNKGGKESFAGMYPDFIILRKDQQGAIRPVIVDPHGAQFSDSSVKLRGLTDYASKYGDNFLGIYPLIQDPKNNKTRTLLLKDEEVREQVTNALDRGLDVVTIYRNHGSDWIL